MKADLRRGSGSGPDESLQSILRGWEAPPPPGDLEEDLRSAFRRRRAGRRGVVWLALAAALALLAMWPLTRREAARAPAGAGAPVPSAAPRPAVVAARPGEPGPGVRIASPIRRASRAKAGVVIVEPRQAELLARLGEDLQRLRPSTSVLSGAPFTVVSSEPVAGIPADAPEPPTLATGGAEVPRYEGAWERVSGVWPPVQLSAPTMWR